MADNETPEEIDDELAQEFDAEIEGSAAPEGETEATESADGGESEDKRGQSRELDSIYAANRRLQQQVEMLTRTVLQQQPPPAEPQQPAETPRPKSEDFETDEDFYEALSDWKADRKLAEWEARNEQREEERQHEAQRTQIEQAYANMHDTGRTKYADYDAVAGSAPVYNPVIGVAIAQSPNAADVSYYLGQNHDIATELDGMDPMAAAIRIGEISASLKQPQKKPPPVSRAPESPRREPPAAASNASDGWNPALSVEENARARLAARAGRT